MLAERCRWQQDSPNSPFVQNAICVKHIPGGVVALLGRVLKAVDREGPHKHLVEISSGVCRHFGRKIWA